MASRFTVVSMLMPLACRVISRILSLKQATAFGAIARLISGPLVKLNERTFRSCGRATALFAAFTLSLSRGVMNRVISASPVDPHAHYARPAVIARCERCVRLGRDFKMESPVIWPDGSVHWLYDRGKSYCDKDGEPAYITSACVDVTDRRLATEGLRQRERDLRLIIDAMPDPVSYVDRKLIYRRVNRTSEDWFQIPAETIVGMHVRELAAMLSIRKRLNTGHGHCAASG